MKERLRLRKLRKFEKKLETMKPQLISKWRDEIEENIRKDYESEMDKLSTEVFALQRDIKGLTQSRDYYKGKYEGIKEAQENVHDKLLDQVQKTSTSQGQLKQEVKHLKQEVQELAADDPDK